MRIQHNIPAMNAYRNYNNNTRSLSKNLEKLSSGYRINRAGDDAAGLAISEKMRAQITGLNAAGKNVKDGVSLVQTAEGAMQEVHDMLGRMKYLATQSSNGTYQDDVDRENLQKEVDSLLEEIDRIADSANFNGQKLLDGSLGGGNGSVKFGGNVTSTKVDATKGTYAAASFGLLTTNSSTIKDGDVFSITVSLKDGKSYTAKVTGKTGNGATYTNQLIDDNGNVVATLGTKTSNTELMNILAGELGKTGLGKEFTITATSKTLSFENLVEGAKAPQIGAVDGFSTGAGMNGTTLSGTIGTDEARTITAGGLTIFNGKNMDDAVFSINGKKFVVLDENLSVGNYEFGKDITVLHKSDEASFLKAISEKAGVKATNDNGNLKIEAKDGRGLNLQIGDTSDSYNQMKVKVADMHSNALGLKGLDISTSDGAAAAIDVVMDAINKVSSVRGDLGAIQNRLEHTSNNISVMTENIQDAEATIRDTDVADEMMKYTKNNILVQSAQAMLAQANQLPQGVLQLLQ